MDLSRFDDKPVRVTLTNGCVYEGIVSYNSEEYNECEWGKDEDGLQFPGMLIGRSEILSVESLEEREDGLWGKYTEPFGRLEEETLYAWGADLVEELLFCEDPEHVIRMLRCMRYAEDLDGGRLIPDKAENLKLLEELWRTTDDAEAKKLAGEIIASWPAAEE